MQNRKAGVLLDNSLPDAVPTLDRSSRCRKRCLACRLSVMKLAVDLPGKKASDLL
jgi:hypothetical protein